MSKAITHTSVFKDSNILHGMMRVHVNEPSCNKQGKCIFVCSVIDIENDFSTLFGRAINMNESRGQT
jgi:NAD-dependent dihydropyrimidine dehydrogenase PreA subunit